MKKLLAIVLCLVMIVSLAACGKNASDPEASSDAPSTVTTPDTQTEDKVTLDFYAFTDMLGNLESSDTAPGAAVLGAKLKELRQENPEGTVIACVGDALSGTPIAGLVQGKSAMDVLNLMGIDAFVLGNHEFDWGPQDIMPALEMAEMPILNGNIYDVKTSELYGDFAPYTIVEMQGVKVGLLGLTTTTTPTIIQAAYAEQLDFEDTVEAAKKWVPEMKEQGAEIVVVIGHLPLYASKDGALSGEVADLANNVEGIDVILGGHNQEYLTGEKIGNTWVAKGDFYGASLAHVEIVYDRGSKTIVNGSAEVCEVAMDGAADEEIAAHVAEHAEEANKLFDVSVAVAEVDLEIDSERECEISNLFAEGVRKVAGTDMAFVNPSGIFEGIPAGEISLRKIYTMNPFDNYVVSTQMTGAQLRELWEITLTADHFKEHKILAFDGLLVTYDASAPDGEKIVSLKTPDGKEIGDEDVFTVATNNYIAGGGNDYPMLAELTWDETGVIQRDAFSDLLEEKGTLQAGLKGWLTVLNAE